MPAAQSKKKKKRSQKRRGQWAGFTGEERRKRKTGKKQTHRHCIKAEKEDTEHVLRAFMSLISYPSNLSAKRP